MSSGLPDLGGQSFNGSREESEEDMQQENRAKVRWFNREEIRHKKRLP
jgi:hypothetical protein